MCQYLKNSRRYVQSYYLWLIESCMRFRLRPRSMTLDELELYKFEFSESRTSIVSDNVVSTSNWSNFWHAFASRGFVSDSWAFLLSKHYTYAINWHRSHNGLTECYCYSVIVTDWVLLLLSFPLINVSELFEVVCALCACGSRLMQWSIHVG